MRYALATTLLLIIAGCSFAPAYHRPALAVPSAFKEAPQNGWRPAHPQDEVLRGAWWQRWHDTSLNALQARLATGNQSLAAALARFDEARALTGAEAAGLLPQLSLHGASTRERVSATTATLRPHTLYNDHLVGGDLSYELDLWGRVRNAVAAARDQAEANRADAAAMELSLRAMLAEDYFTLRAEDATQAILTVTVTAYGKALEVVRARYQGGVIAEADLDEAQTQYNTARTQVADNALKRAQHEHAIAVLIGVPPAQFSLPPASLSDVMPSPDATLLPAALLERRPDIAAAEKRVQAANAQIGVARAAWFPDIALLASGGYETSNFQRLVTAPSRFWSLGPSLTLPLFDGGRISALSDEARAAYDEAVATYRATVLNAYGEVEDVLAALRELEKERETQRYAADASARALQQARYRYSGGLITYLDVVTLQNSALQNRLALIDIEARRMTAHVQLIKVLGGGWQ